MLHSFFHFLVKLSKTLDVVDVSAGSILFSARSVLVRSILSSTGSTRTSIVPSAAEATLKIIGDRWILRNGYCNRYQWMPMDANGCQCPIDPIDLKHPKKHVIYMV